MAITPLPTPPSTSDPSTFATKADALLSALPTFVTEANALQVDVNAKQVTASDASVSALAAQAAAEAASNATKWISGTTYGEGNVVWSPITFKSFRRKVTGAGATDPSLDSTNWAELPLSPASQAEAEAGTDNTKYMSSLRVNQSITARVPSASDTVAGKVELATNEETQTGTDTSRAVTPAGMKAGLNATGSAPIYACRAWVNFNGTGTVAIRASGNVSSITDNGTGDYTVNFTTAMPDDNYVWSGSGYVTSFVTSLTGNTTTYTKTTSAFRVNTTIQNGSNATQILDLTDVYIAVFR